MTIDETVFFQQATLQICSSLDIETALEHSLAYLKDFLPVSHILLDLYVPGLGVVKNIARVPKADGKIPFPPTPMPREAVRLIESHFTQWQEVNILNRPEEHPVSRALFKLTEKSRPKMSILSMPLTVEGKGVGMLAFLADGRDRYSKAHAKLLSLLKEPYTLIIAKALELEHQWRPGEIIYLENARQSAPFRIAGQQRLAPIGLEDEAERMRDGGMLNAHRRHRQPLVTQEFAVILEFDDLDVVPQTARSHVYENFLSNAFGFGGTNCCIVFRGV